MERDHKGKKYMVVMAKPKGDDSMTDQSYRYPKDTWTEKSARSHCTSHKGILFEPAAKESKSSSIIFGKEGRRMVNIEARLNAARLITAGLIDVNTSWSESRAEPTDMLFLGIEMDADSPIQQFPIGKGGKIYRSALVATKVQCASQGLEDIGEAADALLSMIDNRGRETTPTPPTDAPEVRTLNFSVTVEERKGGKKCLRGHAAMFNQETVVGNWFREMILPGAFTDSIVEDDQRALFNHDANFVLGRRSAGTLRLSEDAVGLAIEIDPPETPLIRDLVLAPIQRGDVTQMSFAFRVKGSDGAVWEQGEEGLLDLRKIKRAQVFDVSPVTFPQYTGTDVALRSHTEWRSALTPPQEDVSPPVDKSYSIRHRRRELSLKLQEV